MGNPSERMRTANEHADAAHAQVARASDRCLAAVAEAWRRLDKVPARIRALVPPDSERSPRTNLGRPRAKGLT